MLWQDEVFEVELEDTDAVVSVLDKCVLGKILEEARECAWIYTIRQAAWVETTPIQEDKERILQARWLRELHPR